MEDRVEEVQAVVEVNVGESPSPAKKVSRRRFVQSTLFPQKSPEKKDSGGVEAGEDEGGDDDEECCGSHGRRKRKRTAGRKTAAQPRTAKKAAQNGNVVLQEAIDERDSPGEGSPQMPKEKQRTSARIRRTNGIKVACMKRLPTNTTLSDHISQPVPDLWLEAKKTAEEDSRRFAGRQLHPFFSSWKMGRKNQETANAETGQNLAEKVNKNVECGPIHVYENVKDDITSIDWSNWAFHDGICTGPTCDEHNTSSSLKGSVGSFQLDNILTVPKLLKEPYLDHEAVEHEEIANKAVTASSELVHNVVEPCHLSEDIDADCKVAKLNCRPENSSCLRSNFEQDSSASHEWLLDCLSRANQPQNTLWTYKYQPEKATEVCGNVESVKVINDWLHLWRDRDLRNCKQLFKSDKFFLQEDSSSCDVDSDVESIDEEAGLKNVLLVMGPVGSGKSAAIYACAKEQGFEVIEVNSSDWRSGVVVKQRFGEAVGLHWLKGTPEDPKGLQSMLKGKSSIPKPKNGATDEFEDDVNKLKCIPDDDSANGDANKPIPVPDDETADGAVMMSQRSVCSESINIRDSGDIKTLILFEEVDATLCEDRGFIATIQQLAQTAKRPMILTSNSCCPALPDTLAREEVCFTMPSQKELLRHVSMVCNAEKSNADARMIEKYVQYCQGDVRKTLMHLQFWCQGQQCESGCKAYRTYSPLMFDLDAGHKILPKVIPWGFPSELSEHIEMEITMASCRMEQSPVSLEFSDDGGEMNSIEAKKQAILSRHFAIEDNELIAPVVNAGEVSNSSGSPVAFNRRSTRKNLGIVLFDSEDEISNYVPPGKPENFCRDNEIDLNVSATATESQINWPTSEGFLNPLTCELVHSAGNKLAESCHQCPLTANVDIEPCHSGDISCVPESTFVPETEVYDGTEISARADQTEVQSHVILENIDQPTFKLDDLFETTESACNINVNLVDSEMGDSQNECGNIENLTRSYQVLDECSRMHFQRGPRRLKKCMSNVTKNSVQETWRELHCADLRQRITNEDKNASQAMRLASRMCNLIAEADLLLHDCKILTESADPEIDLIEDSFTFGWHEDQLHMASATAEHGYCIFAKDAADLGSSIGLESRVDIAREMLASTSNSLALGKLLRQDRGTDQTSFTGGRSEGLGTSLERDREASLQYVVHSVVPPKCYLALRGNTMNEYLSILAHMSKTEADRTSESPNNTKRRRKRAPRNYLCSGELSLSPEEISVLLGYSCSSKFQSQSTEMT